MHQRAYRFETNINEVVGNHVPAKTYFKIIVTRGYWTVELFCVLG